MNELDERLQTLERQEQSLVFENFSQEDAVAIGLRMFEKAKAEGHSIAIHISLNRRDVFHLSMDGCTPDNDVWLRKKENMVYRFLQSSYRTVSFCEQMQADLFEFYGLDAGEYAGAGGGFPITVSGAGCVGAVCCGGMMPHQDHQMSVDVLTEYLEAGA